MPWDPDKIMNYGAAFHLKPMYLRLKHKNEGQPYQIFNTHFKELLIKTYPDKYDHDNNILIVDSEEMIIEINTFYYDMFGYKIFKKYPTLYE